MKKPRCSAGVSVPTENRSLLCKGQKIEHRVGEAGQAFVAEVLVDEGGFLGADVVEDGELGGGRADGVLECEGHDDFAGDAWGEVVDIDVAEGFKNLLPRFGEGIEMPHVGFQFGVGVLAEVHIPHAQVVGEEGVERDTARDAGLERGAGDGEGPALGPTVGCKAGRIDFVKRGHDASELDGVEKDAAEEEFLRSIGEASNDVAVVGVACRAAQILAAAALATAVHGGDGDSLAREAEFIGPLAAVAGVAVEFQNRRVRRGGFLGAGILRIDSRPADAGEGEVKNLAVAGFQRVGAFQLGLGVDGIQLGKSPGPVVIKIGRSWVCACVGLELGKWIVEAGHGCVCCGAFDGSRREPFDSAILKKCGA